MLTGLFLFPVLILMGLGFWSLTQSGWGWALGWSLLGCMALAYFLALRWQKKQKLLQLPKAESLAWTERDQAAWKLVSIHADRIKNLSMKQLISLQTYQETAIALARELATFYHPKAVDPLSSLTIPEILTVVELATRDLAQMVNQYLPGGHLLRIKDFQNIKKMAEWYPTVRNITWMLSGIFTPLQTAARYLTSNVGLSGPWQKVQQNVLVWFFAAYVQRLGVYLIELYSGRLRVGAERYLELKEHHAEVNHLRIVLIGQTNVGKSSLVNAILGEQLAATDVLPATTQAQRYALKLDGIKTSLELIDTVGYGSQGPTELQSQATASLIQSADAVLLVLHARSPGRQADLIQLQRMEDSLKVQPNLRRPPVLAVLTHIDLLSPMMEWSPPYDWLNPAVPKARSIHDAVLIVHKQFQDRVMVTVPACTAEGKQFGIQEAVLPALTAILDQAAGVALLRVLNNERKQDRVKKVFMQLLELGKGMMQIVSDADRKQAQ